jgi:uncharacterized cupin superfamily protein
LSARRTDLGAEACLLHPAAHLFQVRLCLLLVMVQSSDVQVVRIISGTHQDKTRTGGGRQCSGMYQCMFGEWRAIKRHQNASQHGSHCSV